MSQGSKLGLGLMAGMAALVMMPQAVEAGTVVASSTADYPVGAQVSNTQRISLDSGDSITVLDGGRTRVLTGPGTFILAAGSAATSNNGALTALVDRRGQARIASSRGLVGSEDVVNTSLWSIDVATPGTICLGSTERVNLWRAEIGQEAEYTIAPAGSPDAGVMVSFAGDSHVARWDAALQMRDGHAYTISNADHSTQITIALLEQPASDPEALAQQLISRGCTVQLGQIAWAAAQQPS